MERLQWRGRECRRITDTAAVKKGASTSRRSHAGFTAIELSVVLAIVALLVTLAAPSFARIIQGASVSSTVNAFLSDIRLARSEAVRRGGNVALCRSDDPEAASPVCSPGAGPAGAGWATGWLIFHDLDGNGERDASDPVLMVRRAPPVVDSISDGGASTVYRFTPLGRLFTGTGMTELSVGGDRVDPGLRRTICIFPTGTARMLPVGSDSCAG